MPNHYLSAIFDAKFCELQIFLHNFTFLKQNFICWTISTGKIWRRLLKPLIKFQNKWMTIEEIRELWFREKHV